MNIAGKTFWGGSRFEEISPSKWATLSCLHFGLGGMGLFGIVVIMQYLFYKSYFLQFLYDRHFCHEMTKPDFH